MASIAIVDKDNWLNIVEWCLHTFGPDGWDFTEPCKIIFENEEDRIMFALMWGT